MATTVNDLAIRAMQLIGALSTGQTPSSDDAQLCLTNLNEMLDGWNTERLNLYVPSLFSGNLVNNQQSYAIGPSGADFNTTNSLILIQTASLITVTGQTIRTPIAILNSEEWARLPEKGLVGYLPDKMFCDYAFPIANMLFNPIPNRTVALELYLWNILAQFVNLTDAVAFRPGYYEALAYNLALKIAPQFGLAQDQTTVQLAMSYKQRMQELNKLSGFPVSPTQQGMPLQAAGGAPSAPPAQ